MVLPPTANCQPPTANRWWLVIAISQWAQAGSALWLAIAVATNHIGVWQIIGAAMVVGIAQSFSAPAYQAVILDLLDDRSRLPNAIAMNSLQFNLSRAVGPLLASLTLASWGTFWCFVHLVRLHAVRQPDGRHPRGAARDRDDDDVPRRGAGGDRDRSGESGVANESTSRRADESSSGDGSRRLDDSKT